MHHIYIRIHMNYYKYSWDHKSNVLSTSAKIFSPILFFSSIWRNFRSVVASGTCCSLKSITVINGILDSFIRQIEPNLHEIHAKHDLNANRLAAMRIIKVVGTNHFAPVWPWNYFIHSIKKFFTLCFLFAVWILHIS